MIEYWIKNGLQLKRYRRFKKEKISVFSILLLLIIGFFSFTAEIWSNSKPLVLRYQGATYFPAVKDYHPSVFGIADEFVTDYRVLKLQDQDWVVWPLNAWDPFESNKNVERYPAPPSRDNKLGTDDRGRDILARILYGFRYSMIFATILWVLTVILAVVFGGVMGYFGGWVDMIGQRLVEILSTVPVLFLLIILVSIFKPTLLLLVLITSIFSWIGLSYYVRGEFLKNRKQDYVQAAYAIGVGHIGVIFRHILPNSMIPILTFSPFIIAGDVYRLAALDYLGFGLAPPTPSWGELLNQAQRYFTTSWWLAVFPSLALFLTLVLLALLGEGLRKAFDPKN
jgi:microcin C transport system permease protein